jgi:hypothetical protein
VPDVLLAVPTVYWAYSLCSTFIYIFAKLLSFVPINNQEISPDVRAEEYVGFHVKYSLFSLDLSQNWYICTDFSKTSQYQIS